MAFLLRQHKSNLVSTCRLSPELLNTVMLALEYIKMQFCIQLEFWVIWIYQNIPDKTLNSCGNNKELFTDYFPAEAF